MTKRSRTFTLRLLREHIVSDSNDTALEPREPMLKRQVPFAIHTGDRVEIGLVK